MRIRSVRRATVVVLALVLFQLHEACAQEVVPAAAVVEPVAPSASSPPTSPPDEQRATGRRMRIAGATLSAIAVVGTSMAIAFGAATYVCGEGFSEAGRTGGRAPCREDADVLMFASAMGSGAISVLVGAVGFPLLAAGQLRQETTPRIGIAPTFGDRGIDGARLSFALRF